MLAFPQRVNFNDYTFFFQVNFRNWFTSDFFETVYSGKTHKSHDLLSLFWEQLEIAGNF